MTQFPWNLARTSLEDGHFLLTSFPFGKHHHEDKLSKSAQKHQRMIDKLIEHIPTVNPKKLYLF